MSNVKKVGSRIFAVVFSATLLATLGLSGCGGVGEVEPLQAPTGGATILPTVSFAATPTSVTSGGTSMLNWSSTNATSCSASGAWSGTKATSGNQSTGALSASRSYSLSCTGSDGGAASASATVTVAGTPPPPPGPTVSLAANPPSVTSGGSSTLTWSTTNATSCTASGNWSGAKAISGSESTGALTTTSQFSLSCTGSAGTQSASATVSVLPPPGPLPAWVNALAIGQWYEIPNTNMSSVDPVPTPYGTWNKVDAWTSFVVDTRTSKVYSVANGGHGDYDGNEVDALELDRDDPRWVEALASTPPASRTPCSEYYADGRPTARHTYYGVTFDEFNDRVMLFGGVWSCGNGTPFLDTIDSYNIGTNNYSPAGTHPRLPSPFDNWWVNYAANPFTGDVYAVTGGPTGRWNRSSNTFTANLGASGSAPGGGEMMTAFDTTRGRIYGQGGEDNGHHLYTLSNNTWTTVTITGPNAANVASLQRGAMVYVPALDAYLVRAAPSGSTVYKINASTFEVTTLATTGGSSIPQTHAGPYNKFLYVPRLRGAVYVPVYGGNAWFLRLH